MFVAHGHDLLDVHHFCMGQKYRQQSRADGATWAADQIVKKGKDIRENESVIGKTAHGLLKYSWLKYVPMLSPFARWMLGLHQIACSPLPEALCQAALFAAEAISFGLVAAAREDRIGHSQNHVPSAIMSLIALEVAIEEYKEVFDRFNRLYPHQTDLPWFQTSRLKSAVRATAVSGSLLALSMGISEALNRLLRVYRDKLSVFSFPGTYSVAVKDKLRKLS